MTEAILLLRCLSASVQAACLAALATRGLARRYPVFWIVTLLGLLQSLRFVDGWSAWVLAAMYGAVAIEACLAQARHFRSLFSFTVGGIMVFAVLSAALGATVCLFGFDILRDGGPVILMGSGCCILLILSTAFFSTFPVTMRANVRWHVAILLALLTGGAVATGLGTVMSPGGRLAAQLVAVGCPLVCYALWTVKLVPSGECFLPLSEIPAEILARLMAQERRPVEVPTDTRHVVAGRVGFVPPRKASSLRWKTDQGA
ncbi:MAG TPA: hypothetical protein VN893_19190 [Bryobacteraceae bacterium]|jgi:hypothetical protein|nr:hypothetical protein [Bryobacteraceae bacterium]